MYEYFGVRSDSNERGVEFLLIDLDSALTFLDAAKLYEDEDHIRQAHYHARRAYEAVLRFLPIVQPDEAQRQTIDAKLELLKGRLASLRGAES